MNKIIYLFKSSPYVSVKTKRNKLKPTSLLHFITFSGINDLTYRQVAFSAELLIQRHLLINPGSIEINESDHVKSVLITFANAVKIQTSYVAGSDHIRPWTRRNQLSSVKDRISLRILKPWLCHGYTVVIHRLEQQLAVAVLFTGRASPRKHTDLRQGYAIC